MSVPRILLVSLQLAFAGCVSAASTSSPEPAPPPARSASASASLPTTSSPPAPATAASSSSPAPLPSATAPLSSAPAPASSEPRVAPPQVEPPLRADDGSVLPQTDERPTTQSPVFERRTRLLFDAILRDDPSLARPFFFPVEAYEQVKAIAKPARDWQYRLWRNFERDVHEYHAKLGADAQSATLDRIEVREPSVRWMKPNSEGNRIGYYRVTRSAIVGKKADGRPLRLELTSMISWRGEWYVVHLHGFR